VLTNREPPRAQQARGFRDGRGWIADVLDHIGEQHDVGTSCRDRHAREVPDERQELALVLPSRLLQGLPR
jgi:hypothetical protein